LSFIARIQRQLDQRELEEGIQRELEQVFRELEQVFRELE
jgi:hypothetical protein